MPTEKPAMLWLGVSGFLLASACSAPGSQATPPRVVRPPSSDVAGAGSGSSSVAGDGSSTNPTDNPVGTLAMVAGIGGGAGSAGDGCAVGQFCAPPAPDPMDCGTLTLQGSVKMVENPGNVLLVFDRSGSMEDDWNGMVKWQAAGTAMINALMPLQDKLTIGAVLFPSPQTGGGGGNQNCSVNPITAADQVTFKPGAQALAELKTGGVGGVPKYQPAQGGRTPTSEAILVADAALRAATLKGTTAAVIITDGEPNCMWDQQQSTTTIMSWLSTLKIKTYVVGIPGSNTGNGPAVLNALAQAGGTMTYLTPTDSMALQTKIADIVSTTVTKGFDSCSIQLDPAAKVPDKLHLVIKSMGQDQDVPHMFPGKPDPAWTVSSDGKTVELLGDLCQNVMAGTYESIGFVFGCVTLPPLDPPPQIIPS
jgi:hypothetical protein